MVSLTSTQPSPMYLSTEASPPITQRDQHREDYKANMALFQEAQGLQNKLRKLIIQAVPVVYIATLRHPMVRYSNTHPQEMLQHLMGTYGTIKPTNSETNMERIKASWNPDTPIEGVGVQTVDNSQVKEATQLPTQRIYKYWLASSARVELWTIH
jgi:hypothetical protein